MLREAAFIYLGVIGTIKILYELRHLDFIGPILSTLTAVLLIYPPIIHLWYRRSQIPLFEKNRAAVRRSLVFFVGTVFVIFPPFLGLNHLYQTVFFQRSLVLVPPPLDLTFIAVQFLLIAFPEELFFRGYLQPLIAKRTPGILGPFGIRALSIGWAVPITSFFFALSHSLITLRWWHFAIFFPSLVFGWLREKTGGLVAPILFHGVSNVIVLWIGNSYR